jgi:hypothetical protein
VARSVIENKLLWPTKTRRDALRNKGNKAGVDLRSFGYRDSVLGAYVPVVTATTHGFAADCSTSRRPMSRSFNLR